MLEKIVMDTMEPPKVESQDEKPQKDILSRIMIVVVLAILIGIAFAYVAKFEGDIEWSLKNITANGGLLFLSCFSVRYLCKHIAMNKARQTEEFAEAKKEAKAATKAIAEKGFSLMIPKYTEAYAEQVYNNTIAKILKDAKIEESVYLEKYATRTKKEILNAFPFENLSSDQWTALEKARKIKRLKYDEKFLESCADKVEHYVAPSDAFSLSKSDRADNLQALAFSAFLMIFSCSLVGTIIVDLSNQALILAVIKIITTLISAGFAIVKGWNMVMKVEIGRFNLQTVEANNCVKWCEQHKQA